MNIKSIFSIVAQSFFAIMLSLFLLSSCGSESQPAEQTTTAETVDSTQATTPTATQTADASKFDFEHFGSFDLAAWKQMPARTEEGGDVEIETIVYEKDVLTLEISAVDMGEYGYATRHALKNANGQVQKYGYLNSPMSLLPSRKLCRITR